MDVGVGYLMCSLLVISPVVSYAIDTAVGNPRYEEVNVGDLSFNFSHNGQTDAMYIFVGETLELNLTINTELAPGFLILRSSNDFVFLLDQLREIEINLETEFPFTATVLITGQFVGIEKLEVIYYLAEGAEGRKGVDIIDYVIKVKRLPVFTQSVIQYIMTVWLVISYITMGAKSDIDVIKDKLKRPWAVLIGMACQFLIMPSMAFAIAHVFALDDSSAMGLIIDGSCPGGWLSNAFSVLLDLDFVLSLTMTFCSTFLALGMMPLNLFIYTRKFTAKNTQLRVPYVELAIQLAFLIIPVGVGLALVAKFPKFKDICNKILKPVATGIVIIGMGTTLPFEYYCFIAGDSIYAAVITLPLFGGIIGLLLAKVACLENRAALTVAIETGCQNAFLALMMVKMFYPLPEADLVSRIPFLVAIFTMIEGAIVTCFYTLFKRLRSRSTKADSAHPMVKRADAKPVKPVGSRVEMEKAVQTQPDGVQNPAFVKGD